MMPCGHRFSRIISVTGSASASVRLQSQVAQEYSSAELCEISQSMEHVCHHTLIALDCLALDPKLEWAKQWATIANDLRHQSEPCLQKRYSLACLRGVTQSEWHTANG